MNRPLVLANGLRSLGVGSFLLAQFSDRVWVTEGQLVALTDPAKKAVEPALSKRSRAE